MAYSLGTSYTMAAFTGNGTKTQAVNISTAGMICKIAITVPANKIITISSASSGSTAATFDTYASLSLQNLTTLTSRNATGEVASDDQSGGNNQYLLNYSNGSNTSLYLYHSSYYEAQTGTSTVTVTVSDGWSLGNSYTMASFSTANGTYTNSISYSAAAGKVCKTAITIPAYGKLTCYSTEASNIDTYGYLSTSGSATIYQTSGAPNSYTTLNDDGSSNKQFLLTYDNSLNASATTVYIYSRAKSITQATSGTIVGSVTIHIPAWSLMSLYSVYTALNNVFQINVNISAAEKVYYARFYVYGNCTITVTTAGFSGNMEAALSSSSTISTTTGLPTSFYLKSGMNVVANTQTRVAYTNDTTAGQWVYFYLKYTNYSATGSGTVVVDTYASTGMPTISSSTGPVMKRYNGSSWELVN